MANELGTGAEAEELELTEEQVERLDELDDAAYRFLQVLMDDPGLAWDMRHIGELLDIAADFMYKNGFRIRYPAIEEGPDGARRVEYYEPDRQICEISGATHDGAYWDSRVYGDMKDMLEDMRKFHIVRTEKVSHRISVWAKDMQTAKAIAAGITKDELDMFPDIVMPMGHDLDTSLWEG